MSVRNKQKSNQGKGRQHVNVLKPSRKDDTLLCIALDTRYRELCQMYGKVKGEMLVPPSHFSVDMVNWRQMFVRQTQGDYRRTDDELKSVQRIAQWTLDLKNELCGQERVVLEWDN